MNLFVLNALLEEVTLKQIFRGVWLFVLMLIGAMLLVLEWPGLAMWLPGFMA
jgi:TRAP-type C4-dicarboxylate transport system permease large subunit